MIGIIPGSTKTFEVEGTFNDTPLTDGKLYADTDGRIYCYSSTLTRSNPTTGFFPVWNGSKRFVSKFSNEKYLDKDVIRTDLTSLSAKIDGSVAENIRYLHRKSTNGDTLKPVIQDNDNMFTQVIKGIILKKQVSLVDLIDMSKLKENMIENYYSSLNKISFMRRERWEIWLTQVFKLTYSLTVYRDSTFLVRYDYPDNTIDSGVVKYDNVTSSSDEPFKRIVKILMVRENINKANLRSDEVDDYTINNLLTTLGANKPLSAQLFSRFIRISGLNYAVEVYEDGSKIFEYKE